MEIIIIGFHVALVIGIVLLVQAIRERKKQRLLGTSQTQETKQETSSTITTADPVSEQKEAVQIVHNGLENVLSHATSTLTNPNHRPEMVLSEISAVANGDTESASAKHCPSCNEPMDDAFDFCLKCSAPQTT
jgi:predicted metalloprotease